MKKLLIAFALTTPLFGLATCGKHTPEVPKVPPAFNEMWDAVPKEAPVVTEEPQVAPEAPQAAPAPTPRAHHAVKHHRKPVYHRAAVRLPAPPPPPPEEPEEVLPKPMPCLFLSALIPSCIAGVP